MQPASVGLIMGLCSALPLGRSRCARTLELTLNGASVNHRGCESWQENHGQYGAAEAASPHFPPSAAGACRSEPRLSLLMGHSLAAGSFAT